MSKSVERVVPGWTSEQIYNHLSAYLFRGRSDACRITNVLSGGERARLVMAQISARTPTLLVLDEITNNLDIETRGHVAKVL